MIRTESVVFQIGGPIRDPEIGRRLIVAISMTTLAPREDEDEFEQVVDIVDHLEGAEMGDLEMHARSMTLEQIEAFEMVCRDLDLSYLRRLTDRGTEDEMSWVPGLVRPISSSMVGTGTSGEADYGIPLELVREAASKGLDAVGELIAAYDVVHSGPHGLPDACGDPSAEPATLVVGRCGSRKQEVGSGCEGKAA